jgi:hypothetical protein
MDDIPIQTTLKFHAGALERGWQVRPVDTVRLLREAAKTMDAVQKDIDHLRAKLEANLAS